MPFYMRIFSSVASSVGEDHGSAVSNRYSAPFAFNGTIHEIVIQLPPRSSRSAEAARARNEMSRQ